MIRLAVIVKDEAAVIERCLDSARGFVSSYVIVDTGSSDDTVERIMRHPMPGVVHHRPWRNFGENRTELLKLARGPGHLLLLDADMEVAGEAREPLVADAYMLPYDGDLEYSQPLLVRGDRPWRYIGETHEYLDLTGATVDASPGLEIRHRMDGDRRKEKFESDLVLLSEAHRKDPGDARTVFYLANTYRDLGLSAHALKHYVRRAEMGGWSEEVYCSLLEAGRIHKADDRVDDAAQAWNRAVAVAPHRGEAAYELVGLRLARGELEEALDMANAHAARPQPSGLFVEPRPPFEQLARLHA